MKQATNKDKQQTGTDVKKGLHDMIEILHNNFPDDFNPKYNEKHGQPGKQKGQFKSEAELHFHFKNAKDEIWIIKTTNSYRSDREKTSEFDAENLKQILSKPSTVVKAYFVLPDSITQSEISAINKFNEKVVNQKIVTHFDGALLMSELDNLIRSTCLSMKHQGKRSNILGRLGEHSIIQSFRNRNNITLWNNYKSNVISYNYRLFFSILTGYGIQPNKPISSITDLKTGSVKPNNPFYDQDLATAGPKNGKPKTDVYIEIKFKDGTTEKLKLSIKCPDSEHTKVITIQQTKVQKILKDLHSSLPADSFFLKDQEKEFQLLTTALLNLQSIGAPTKMDPIQKDYLDRTMYRLDDWFADFFFFGENNSLFNDKQKANLLVSFDPVSGTPLIYTKKKVHQLLKKTTDKSFSGSHFSWTYPSKGRGKEVTIKGPIF